MASATAPLRYWVTFDSRASAGDFQHFVDRLKGTPYHAVPCADRCPVCKSRLVWVMGQEIVRCEFGLGSVRTRWVRHAYGCPGCMRITEKFEDWLSLEKKRAKPCTKRTDLDWAHWYARWWSVPACVAWFAPAIAFGFPSQPGYIGVGIGMAMAIAAYLLNREEVV